MTSEQVIDRLHEQSVELSKKSLEIQKQSREKAQQFLGQCFVDEQLDRIYFLKEIDLDYIPKNDGLFNCEVIEFDIGYGGNRLGYIHASHIFSYGLLINFDSYKNLKEISKDLWDKALNCKVKDLPELYNELFGEE